MDGNTTGPCTGGSGNTTGPGTGGSVNTTGPDTGGSGNTTGPGTGYTSAPGSGIIAQVYWLSAVHCQMTRYTERVPGYLTRYSVSANEISFDKKSANQIVFHIR